MESKRGPKTRGDLKQEILLYRKRDPSIPVEKIREKLIKKFPKTRIPKDRAIYNIIHNNQDKINFDYLDTPWSIGFRDMGISDKPGGFDLTIPNEEIAGQIMVIQDFLLQDERYLTVRVVKWIIKLYPFIHPILNSKYPTQITQNARRLFEIACLYNRSEQLAELNEEPYHNTSDLDKKYIIDQDVSFLAYLRGWSKAFLLDIFEQEKQLTDKQKLTPAEYQRILAKFDDRQIESFFQILNSLISGDNIETFIKEHPEVEPIADRLTTMFTRRGMARLFAYFRENKSQKAGE